MLDRLPNQPADALLALIKMHADDRREDTIDLGVGVYRTGDGKTPVFGAVKAAEARLVERQRSKSYLGPEGDTGFVAGLMPYIFGASDPDMGGRIAGMQTPGGTGAVRLAVALALRAGVKSVHLGLPSWPNHAQILDDLGVEAATFPHVAADGAADLGAVLAAIAEGEGAAVLLHACCHNPTGVDYTNSEWDAIAEAFAASGALPILDSAYQGLGQGLEEDAYGLRRVLAAVPEALVAYSCDKNFGVYRDRVGAFYMMARTGADLPAITSNANALARANWSMPPDHGGAAVRIVLEDQGLTRDWLAELDTMRARMRGVRAALAAADNQVPGLGLAALGEGNGLFAMLPLNKEQIEVLRTGHGIYMAGSGRINVAGLTEANIPKFIAALGEVTA